jgi:predicted Fe-Mo cluster-binding NifX family protein
VGSILLELPRDESFHDSSPLAPHPLDDVDVLIAGGMGQGLARRLERRGMHPVVTAETDPETAVRQYLAGTLQVLPAHGHHGGHEHGHRHG